MKFRPQTAKVRYRHIYMEILMLKHAYYISMKVLWGVETNTRKETQRIITKKIANIIFLSRCIEKYTDLLCI